MDRICGDQCYIAVDAAAGVPTAGGDIIDGFYSDHIIRGAVAGDIVGNIKSKSGVAVVMLTQKASVDVDVSIGIDTVKVQKQGFSGVAFR